jgi:ferric-dicitrate binding protein FerR (iron transport regulator)
MKNELYILLEKFLNKKANAEEAARLMALFHQPDARERLLNFYEEKWEGTTSASANPEVQEQIWMRLQKQIAAADAPAPVRLSIWKKYSRIAAAILLPLLFACLGYYYSENRFYQSTDKMVVCVDKGQKAGLQLPDGTQVWLNSASSLTYDKSYNQKDRVVYLQGEAYFDVGKDKTKPFIVQTGEISVEAIGTGFNVKAYPDDNYITTTLIEGCVRVHDSFSSDTLSPNESLVFSRVNRQFAKNILPDAERHTLWRSNQLAFEQERLEDIAKVLERMYNVQIKFASENLKNVRFSGKVKNNNLESILQLIAFVSPIRYSMDNDSTVTIHENRPRNRHASPQK